MESSLNFPFNFDLPEDVDKTLKHEMKLNL